MKEKSLFVLLFLCTVTGGKPSLPSFPGEHVVEPRNRPLHSDDSFKRFGVPATAIFDKTDDLLEKYSKKERPISRAKAKAEHVMSNYAAEFFDQYVSHLWDCETNFGQPWKAARKAMARVNLPAWPLATEGKPIPVSIQDIEKGLDSEKFAVRERASRYFWTYLRDFELRLIQLEQQTRSAEVKQRIGNLLGNAKELKSCYREAQAKYAQMIWKEIYPEGTFEPCAKP